MDRDTRGIQGSSQSRDQGHPWWAVSPQSHCEPGQKLGFPRRRQNVLAWDGRLNLAHSHLSPDKQPLSVKFLELGVTGWGAKQRAQPSPGQNPPPLPRRPPKEPVRNQWWGTCQFSVTWSTSKLRIIPREPKSKRPVCGSKQDFFLFQNIATTMSETLGGNNVFLSNPQKQAVEKSDLMSWQVFFLPSPLTFICVVLNHCKQFPLTWKFWKILEFKAQFLVWFGLVLFSLARLGLLRLLLLRVHGRRRRWEVERFNVPGWF